jgi:MFS superfamily sulfate permease-like transporter
MSNSTIVSQITDTLSKKPEYGIVSSILSISLSATDILQFIGIIIGLFIAMITAVLKVMELREKLKERRKVRKKATAHPRG